MNCEKWRELAAKFANQCVKEENLEDTLLTREACAVGWLCAAVEIMELERDSLTRRLNEFQSHERNEKEKTNVTLNDLVENLYRENKRLREELNALRQAADDFVANVRGHHIAGWGEIEVASDRSFQDLVMALDRLKMEG